MKIKVIHNEEAYEAAVEEIEKLMDKTPSRGSDEFEALELLALVIKAYEEKRFGKLAGPDPVEAIKFRMEQMGLKPSDLQGCLGSRSRVYEILSGKRDLSKAMMRSLHQRLHIPADVLIGG